MELDPASLDLGLKYKLLVGAVVPRPIAFVSTVSPDGVPNLAPFSFFAGVSANPWRLLFCPANNSDGSEKDTLRNCAPAPVGTGECCISIVSEAIARRMAITAAGVPFGDSEFDLSALTPAPSKVVRPARVTESPITFECRVHEIMRLAPGAPAGGNVVLAEPVWVHAHDGLIDERMRIDPDALRAVGRMAGLGYCTTRQQFDLSWGHDAVTEPEIDFEARFGAR
ncbi:MAG: flavin reductase family protein [Phycisphaerales bacterium]